MIQALKAVLGLLVTVLAVAAKLAAYVNSTTAAIFDNTAVTTILLVLMGAGLFMFAYYSMPDRLTENISDNKPVLSKTTSGSP